MKLQMTRYLKTVAVLMLVVPLVFVMAACGDKDKDKDKDKDGTGTQAVVDAGLYTLYGFEVNGEVITFAEIEDADTDVLEAFLTGLGLTEDEIYLIYENILSSIEYMDMSFNVQGDTITMKNSVMTFIDFTVAIKFNLSGEDIIPTALEDFNVSINEDACVAFLEETLGMTISEILELLELKDLDELIEFFFDATKEELIQDAMIGSGVNEETIQEELSGLKYKNKKIYFPYENNDEDDGILFYMIFAA